MIREFLNTDFITDHLEVWLFFILVLAMYISYKALPLVIAVAIKKHLYDEPDERSTHNFKIPTLGGIGIYVSLMLCLMVTGVVINSQTLIILAGGLTILFFLGLKDDLYLIAPRKKFLGQLLASGILVMVTDIRIIGFSNMFSVETLPYWVSIIFTIFVFLLIINALNLIDGINGLAGSIALMASLIFAVIFYQSNSWTEATLAIALAGAIIPFLRLNLIKPKIFMGDTGSMILGFMLAFFTISFINQVQTDPNSDFYNSVPIMVQAILFFPLLDTLRIFIIRIFVHKTSPFKADRNHIHHRLLDLGYSHLKSTSIILMMNLAVIVLALSLQGLEIHIQLLCVSCFGIFLFLLPFFAKLKTGKNLAKKLHPTGDK